MYKSFISLVRFILNCFIFLDAIVSGIIFLISFLDGSLVLHRNAIDFCLLILYPTTLLNFFISSNSLFVESLGVSLCKIMSSVNKDHFTSSFPIWIF